MRHEPIHRPSALPHAVYELSHDSTLQAELTQPREPTSLLFVVDNTRFPAIPQFWNLPDRLPYFWIHPGTRDAAHQHLYPAPGNWSSPRCSLRLFTLRCQFGRRLKCHALGAPGYRPCSFPHPPSELRIRRMGSSTYAELPLSWVHGNIPSQRACPKQLRKPFPTT
jgi:hypothetical protein